MDPVVFQSVPDLVNFAGIAILLQICIMLFVTGRKYLRWVSVEVVALVGAMIGSSVGGALGATAGLALSVAFLVGGGILGVYLRPVGMAIVLAYLGFSMAGHVVGLPLIQYFVAVDLFAYGLLLTDLAPSLVSGLLASSLFLLMALWAGVPSLAALSLAVGAGAARSMASILPSRLATRFRTSGTAGSVSR